MKRTELNEVVDAQLRAAGQPVRAAVQKATGTIFEAGITPEQAAAHCDAIGVHLRRIADALRAKGGAR